MPHDPKFVKKRAPTLYFIIGFKLLKGVLGLLLALGVYSLTDNNLPDEFQRLLMFLHLDPEKEFFVDLANRVAAITPANLKWVAAGSVVYASFMLVQAGGLFSRVGWAGWLAIGESAFFIPIEVFELVHRPSLLVFTVLGLNIMMVWYLFANRNRLFRHHH
jgi:uncharacterized membrane protein (DUF2068 family)